MSNETYTDKTTNINGYSVELTFDKDGDDVVSSCFVESPDGRYSASLGLLGDFGYLEQHSAPYGQKTVAMSVIERIEKWAMDNGW